MDDFTTASYIIGGAFVVVGCILLLVYRLEKQRTEAMRKSAKSIGFSFSDKKDIKDVGDFRGFKLFSIGRSRKIKNFMQGMRDQISWSIFDYRYTTAGGKNSQTYSQTVTAAKLNSPLPEFFLGKEQFYHRIAEKFGYQDINFENNPGFSGRFLLRGPEAEVRRLFKPEVQEFFERMAAIYTIEAKGHNMIIYRRSKKIKPAQVRQYLDEMAGIVMIFEKAAQKGFQ